MHLLTRLVGRLFSHHRHARLTLVAGFAAAAISALSAREARGVLLVSDNFNDVSNGANINGRVTTGGTWAASTSTFLGTGSGDLSADINQGASASINLGAGYLSANPGVYDLSLDATQPTSPNAASWVAVGFAPLNTTTQNFVGDNGAPWILYRNNGQVVVFAGPANTNQLFASSTGAFATGTIHNLKLQLDTSSASWTLNAFVDNTAVDLNGAAAGTTFTYATNPATSQYVGMAVGQNGTTSAVLANVDNFQLTTTAPEPSSAAVMLAATGILALRRRRRMN